MDLIKYYYNIYFGQKICDNNIIHDILVHDFNIGNFHLNIQKFNYKKQITYKFISELQERGIFNIPAVVDILYIKLPKFLTSTITFININYNSIYFICNCHKVDLIFDSYIEGRNNSKYYLYKDIYFDKIYSENINSKMNKFLTYITYHTHNITNISYTSISRDFTLIFRYYRIKIMLLLLL